MTDEEVILRTIRMNEFVQINRSDKGWIVTLEGTVGKHKGMFEATGMTLVDACFKAIGALEQFTGCRMM
jgi:hypothetical protein